MSVKRHHSGAVSIFIVIFTALLITVVTVSFARLMLREQQRASDNDLSQSAYDAALAGVEDAKRALVRGSTTGVDLNECNAIKTVLNDGSSSDDGRVGDESLQQAYTCVKVQMATDDYVGVMGADETNLVPLKATEPFDTVRVDWFSKEDVSTGGGLPGSTTSLSVPASGSLELEQNWPTNRPSVLETQLIQTGSEFSLEEFDDIQDGESNTNTLFLYPQQSAVDGVTKLAFISDVRRIPPTLPDGVKCMTDLNTSLYACSALISLPEPRGGDESNRENAFLRLTARYNGTHYRVQMFKQVSVDNYRLVRFDGVQPIVDSTARANDLFRRVLARVEPAGAGGAHVAYPAAAVDVTGNFCKTFRVTDDFAGYETGNCIP